MQRHQRRPHPWLFVWFALAWVAGVYIQVSWLSQVMFLATVLFLTYRTGRRQHALASWLVLSLPLVLVYTVVGSLFAEPGDDLWWVSPHLPLLGRLSVSTQSVTSSLYRALRLWDLLLLFMAVGAAVKTEDVIHWFGKHFSRVGLTVAMVLHFIPGLMTERNRISELVRMRGGVGAEAPLCTRVRAQGIVYQTLLMNALDRSWLLSESMHVRGYGTSERTLYQQAVWSREDVGLAIVLAATVLLCAAAVAWPAVRSGGTLLRVVEAVAQAASGVWMGRRLRG